WAGKDNLPAVHKTLLTDSDRDVRKSMIKIIDRLKDDSSILPLAARLGDRDDRIDAGKLLLAYGNKAEGAVLGELNSTDRARRTLAEELLGAIGGKASEKLLLRLHSVLNPQRDREERQYIMIQVNNIRAREKKAEGPLDKGAPDKDKKP